MKSILTAFLALSLGSSTFAFQVCGYISQEVEGTWLEIPYKDNDSKIEFIFVLQGHCVANLQQGSAVCVNFKDMPTENGEILVDGITPWNRQ